MIANMNGSRFGVQLWYSVPQRDFNKLVIISASTLVSSEAGTRITAVETRISGFGACSGVLTTKPSKDSLCPPM